MYEFIKLNSAADPCFVGKSTKSCKRGANIVEHLHDANSVFKDSK